MLNKSKKQTDVHEEPEVPEVHEKSFWDKVKSGASKMGEEVAILGIKTYLCMLDSNTPKRHKVILGTAIAYLILPVDAIPDAIVGVGYTDDLGALVAAGNAVDSSLTEEHDAEARVKWNKL
ncbi:putative membrane protein [Vibrio phage 2.275.O._10N.286.54.E11]|nr:putative membrane protein [Vibrio phage 2.275.O._10N.286.54.E11]